MLRLNDGVEGAGVLVRPGKGGEIEGGVPVLEQGSFSSPSAWLMGTSSGKPSGICSLERVRVTVASSWPVMA